jgi:ribose transport system permease protein
MSSVNPTERRSKPPWTAILASTEAGLIVAILAMLALIFVLEPTHGFFQRRTLGYLANDLALYGVLAVGAAVVIISGGIDLSVGSIVALSAVLAARMMRDWLPGGHGTEAPLPLMVVAGAIAASLSTGALVGGLHALMINYLRLPPFIATLATMAGLRSVANLVCESRTVSVSSPTFSALGNKNAYAVTIFAIVAISASLMMGLTVLGRHLYALGGNEKAARLCGLRTRRLKATAYILSGVLAALAGLLFLGKVGSADNRSGQSYELFAITAAVVGGCSLAGGAGSIRGTVLGLILLQIVIKGTSLVVTSIDSSRIEGLVLGVVVVVAVAFNQRFRGRS